MHHQTPGSNRSAFPLVLALGSAHCAVGAPALFPGFITTTARSDFSIRALSASAPRLPDAGRRPPLALPVSLEISRFPYKERACITEFSTVPGRTGACDDAPSHVAFRGSDDVGTRIEFLLLNGWSARTPVNASSCSSRYMVRFTFAVRDLHPLLLAGPPALPTEK